MKRIQIPQLGVTFQVLSGNHQGETATVVSVREPHLNDPIVTVRTSTGMINHWRPAWGPCGMPKIQALSATLR